MPEQTSSNCATNMTSTPYLESKFQCVEQKIGFERTKTNIAIRNNIAKNQQFTLEIYNFNFRVSKKNKAMPL